MQLIVLGMHRSGTSAVTRLLNMAGAYFGPEGISNGADEGNLKGFWERVDVRAVCDGLLQESGLDWWKLADFSLDRISEPVRARHIDRFERILLELDAHRPWVLKEPRLSVLFPLVRPLLEVPVCVHVTREPLEIADSLQTRNGFPAPAGVALWELYTIQAFQGSAGLPHVHVRYQDVMSSPVAATARLIDQLTDLGVAGLRVPTDREITAYIDPDLHREHRSPDRRRLWLNDQQMALATAIDDGTVLDDGVVPERLSDGAHSQLRALEEGRARLTQVSQLEDEVDQRRNEETRLQKDLDQAQDEIESLRKRFDALAERADSARRLLDAADRQLNFVARSRTWRLAWGAHNARRRILHADQAAVSEPLRRTSSIVDRARQELAEPGRGPSTEVEDTESIGRAL